MGRYESQRAIAARTISYRRRGRKRGFAWRRMLVRLLALTFTVAAILAGAWYAPMLNRPAPEAPPLPIAAKMLRDVSTAKAEAAPFVSPAPRRGIVRRLRPAANVPAPLDPFEGAEILDASELDALSQAR